MSLPVLYDVCVVGSGAGAGPIIYELSKAGFQVVVIEKGAFIKTEEFNKDELAVCRKNKYSPSLEDEYHVIEYKNKAGEWVQRPNYKGGSNFWNGTVLGGASNFMSGHFWRMKPIDFKLKSTFGAIEGANIVDWPITYDDLEPYYEKVERIVGISGSVKSHEFQEPRSTKDFPFPRLAENIVSGWLDDHAKKQGLEMIPTPRAILSRSFEDRKSCYLSGYCGSYGCSSDAKSSSRAALINKAIATGNCTIICNAKAKQLMCNEEGRIEAVEYRQNDQLKTIFAKQFVVACNTIESIRLLASSKSNYAPNGIGNNNGQLGKNLISSSGGIGGGKMYFNRFKEKEVQQLRVQGNFINRGLFNWYEFHDQEMQSKIKGGFLDFNFEHSNAFPKLRRLMKDHDKLVYGSELKQRIKSHFTEQRTLKFEVFCDWLPTDNCYVELSPEYTDKWGDPVAKIRLNMHAHDKKVAAYLGEKGEQFLKEFGVEEVFYNVSTDPSTNLMAGGCRFGDNPALSVLDSNCKVHDISNLYVSDGSFMPTGGSVPYTWTIYANSFRVADKILTKLKS